MDFVVDHVEPECGCYISQNIRIPATRRSKTLSIRLLFSSFRPTHRRKDFDRGSADSDRSSGVGQPESALQ